MTLLAFPLSAIILGIINAALVVVILLLIGAIVKFVFDRWVVAIPEMIVKLYIAACALVGLYLVVAILFGLPIPPSLSVVGR